MPYGRLAAMTDPIKPAQMFQLEEYRALRKELEIYIAEFRSQERNVVIALGVIWGWLISHQQSNWQPWLLPVILCGAASMRSVVLNIHMGLISSYIESLEKDFGLLGWEYTFRTKGRRQKGGISKFRLGDWVNLILTSTLFLLAIAGLWYRAELARALVSPR